MNEAVIKNGRSLVAYGLSQWSYNRDEQSVTLKFMNGMQVVIGREKWDQINKEVSK